ncbi:MAG: nicotinate-nucleotide adenylyltransferase [Oscillatoriaceae cyanobacterium]
MKIALFGTSADPPTMGHQAILSWLCGEFDWVAVWAADNPMKLQQQTPLNHRAAMLQLVVAEIQQTDANIGVYPELSSPYTIETVNRARQLWPDAVLTLVIGADLVGQIHRWYRAAELLCQVPLLVVPRMVRSGHRSGYVADARDWERLQQMGARVRLAEFVPPATSSTAYRQGEDKDGDIVPPVVKEYIQRQNLFSVGS